MFSIRKILKSKLRYSSFGKEGRQEKYEANNSPSVRTVINEEYKEAFRTKSYTEICNKMQGQTRICLDHDANSFSSSPMSSSPPSSPPSHHIRLSEYLVEPRHETLVSISQNPSHHRFLTNYFDTSLEASRICESILQTIHQVRNDHHTIHGVVELLEQNLYYKSMSHKNLASLPLNNENPFAEMTPEKFHDLHERHQHFLHQLTSKCSKTRRHKKFTRLIKKGLMITGCGALIISLLLLAIHSVVGAVAAPGIIFSFLVIFLKKRLKREERNKKRREEKAQVDVAARGIYILINDFDTMSRLVQRVYDEMEHRKFAAGVCVRKGKKEAVKEVVKEFQMHELGFMEQLEELEKQIYLCFLDINRSRRLLIQELDKYSS